MSDRLSANSCGGSSGFGESLTGFPFTRGFPRHLDLPTRSAGTEPKSTWPRRRNSHQDYEDDAGREVKRRRSPVGRAARRSSRSYRLPKALGVRRLRTQYQIRRNGHRLLHTAQSRHRTLSVGMSASGQRAQREKHLPLRARPPHPRLAAQERRRTQRGPRNLRLRPHRLARPYQHRSQTERGGEVLASLPPGPFGDAGRVIQPARMR